MKEAPLRPTADHFELWIDETEAMICKRRVWLCRRYGNPRQAPPHLAADLKAKRGELETAKKLHHDLSKAHVKNATRLAKQDAAVTELDELAAQTLILSRQNVV